jgi:hypothetical protein
VQQSVLVVFVDALGPGQLARMAASLPFAPHHGRLRGVLGYSCSALPTILTGAPPSVHGRMCLFARGQREGGILAPLSWLGLLPSLVHERRRVRDLCARLLRRANDLTGYVALHRIPPAAFRWLDIPEKEDLFTAPHIGGASTFLAEAREAGLSVYASPWQLPEEARWAAARSALRQTPPDLAFLYSAELDGALHREGNDGPAPRAAAARLGQRIEAARDALAHGGRQVTTLIVGDHGMADVVRAVDPRPILARNRRVRAFVDSTMLRAWGDGPDLRALERDLVDSGVGGRWLSTADLKARSAPTEGARFGDAIHVLDEGALFAPSFLGGRVQGMHGYDLGSPSSFAALASSEPLTAPCDSLTDIATIVRARLGLRDTRAPRPQETPWTA